ncbi:MAG: acyl-CoA reductase [Bacteroidia bacterium]
MSHAIAQTELSNSLFQLREAMDLAYVPESVLAQALADNPWHTPYYIARSLEGIKSWLQADTLETFLSAYTQRPSQCQRIGIITAGNLPLVGFHDLLIGILSGHQVFVRSSHQDKALMAWIVDCWIKCLPALEQYISLVEELPQIDFLIATGSNNTARYLRNRYRRVPQLIRQNRFSVAIVDEQTDEGQLQKLADDVLLYNGLGCRNVSTLILTNTFALDAWINSLQQYSPQRLNPHYLERVLHERHKMKMLGASFIDGGIILMQAVKALKYASMGVLNLLRVDNEAEIETILSSHRDRLQCIVGKETPYGHTQIPAIDDFADGIDTMALLTCR